MTQYVQTEMGKADQLDGQRKGAVGFALASLQRRLASSPEAIFQSLKRRKERLERRVREEKLGIRGQILAETLADVPEDDDDLDAEEQESLEETLVDQATAARTTTELEAEIVILQGLERQAKAVVVSEQDRKWDELSRILQNNPSMQDAGGRQRKLIIFSEHRDTLNYLHAKIAGVLGNADAIVTIHGGTHRDERRRIQALFRSDPEVRVLVATDAAGEGVNLQNANLMVNYDLPWNPNRLEQRFGRIHRIGQQKVTQEKIRSGKGRAKWEEILRLHLIPHFGTYALDDIHQQEVEEWFLTYGKAVQTGELSPHTANTRIRILRVIYGAASAKYKIANPTDGVDLYDTTLHPTYSPEEPNSLTVEELPRFLDAMYEHRPRHFAVSFLGFVTGLRPSTLFPLRVREDIRWSDREIWIRRSHTYKQEVMPTTKTGRGYPIGVPEQVLRILQWHVDHQIDEGRCVSRG